MAAATVAPAPDAALNVRPNQSPRRDRLDEAVIEAGWDFLEFVAGYRRESLHIRRTRIPIRPSIDSTAARLGRASTAFLVLQLRRHWKVQSPSLTTRRLFGNHQALHMRADRNRGIARRFAAAFFGEPRSLVQWHPCLAERGKPAQVQSRCPLLPP